MGLVKRGNIWWGDFVRKGRRYQFSCHTRSKPEAKDFADKIMAMQKAPGFEEAVRIARAFFPETATPQVKLEDIWTKYAETAKALGRDGITDKGMRDRENRVKRLVRWIRDRHPGIDYAEKISATVASQYAKELAEEGRTAKTRINIIGDLSAVWSVLEKVSDEIHNPWHNLQPKKTGSQRIEAFTVEQEKTVLEAAKKEGKDWYPICMVCRHTGLRYHDVAQLRWSEIEGLEKSQISDLKSQTIGDGSQISDLKSQITGRAVIRKKPIKTVRHGISVAIPLLPEVVQALEAIRNDGRKGDYCFPVHAAFWGKKGLIGRVLNFRNVLDRAGITGNYTIHSWRHTTATRLADAGVDIETRMRLLGHTVKDTARLYDHSEHLDETRKAIEAAANAAARA